MKYRSQQQFTHRQQDKVGVLITNLGTPDAPTAKALRPYLKQFLSDPRVVEVPRLIWWMILNGVILNIRPRRSAKAYDSVWTEQGSPLMVHTQAQSEALKNALQQAYGDDVVLDFAMRYGHPSIESKLDAMLNQGVRKLLVLPLYPQYCAATTASTFDAIASDFQKRRWLPELRFVNHYCDEDDYIDALANKIAQHWRAHGRADKLIFSYHGIPQRYLHKGDPYFCQCHKTSRLLAEKLRLSADDFMTCFQSRFGREAWLQPYLDHTLKALPDQGIKSVQVVCPGFSADCLETIEEVGEENRDYFLEAGGERYQYIAALNSDPAHIDFLQKLIVNNISGWLPVKSISDRAELAKRQGASDE
jgi:ferrochelatase